MTPPGGRGSAADAQQVGGRIGPGTPRGRMLDAMAHVVAEKGYGNASVADVVARAGVSRRTFYEQFADKEACFLAAYDAIFADIMAAVVEAYDSRQPWPERIDAGLSALIGRFTREPAYARAGIVEVLAAGPAAIERRDAALRAFQTFFDPARPEVPDHHLPPIVAEATIGGIYEVMYHRIVTQGPDALADVRGALVELALAPFLGLKAAQDVSRLRDHGDVSPAGAARREERVTAAARRAEAGRSRSSRVR